MRHTIKTPKFVDFKDGHRIITLNRGERDFLRLCCSDMPYWQIAEKMGKSLRTIDGYRDALFTKLRVGSIVGLVLWCFKIGFFKRSDIKLKRRQRKSRQQ